MSKVIKTDIAIMGSGLAGMAAAYRLRGQQDLKIDVFEKRPFQGGAVSNCPMMFASVPDTPRHMKSALDVMSLFTNYEGDLGLARTEFKYSALLPEIVFNELGLICEGKTDNPPESYGTKRGYTTGFPNGMDIGDYYFMKGRGKGHGAALVVLRMRQAAEKAGVRFHFSTPIYKIQKENNKIVGALAKNKDGEDIQILCKALIVASGGISGSPEMLKKELGLNYTDDDCTNGGNVAFHHFKDSRQEGDGQRAVWEAGGYKGGFAITAGASVPGPGIVGHNVRWLSFSQLRVVQGMPYLWVNEDGRRFMNEEMTNQHMAVCAYLYNQPNSCGYLIFDEDTAHKMSTRGVEDDYVYFIFRGKKLMHPAQMMDKVIEQGNKHVWHADTIKELCQKMGINEENLRNTLREYNSFCENGEDLEFGKDPRFLYPVREESGHVYAMRIFLTGYDTLGGIHVDRFCRVLDTDKRPIPGLYSAGDMVAGSLYGDPPFNASPSFTASVTTGLAAADYAAEYVGRYENENKN